MQHFISSFGDPVIKILLIVLAVNVIVMFRNSDWYETIGIALSILLSTTISTVSEYGSESAFLAMQQDAETIRCKVRRAGTVSYTHLDVYKRQIHPWLLQRSHRG